MNLRALCLLLALSPLSVIAADYAANFPRDLAAWRKAADSVTKVSVDGSSLVVENATPKDDHYALIELPVGATGSAPVEIVARVRIRQAPANRQAALVWHSAEKGRSFFQYYDSGDYELYDWADPDWRDRRPVTKVAGLRQGEINEIAVRVIGGRAFHFINGAAVDVLDFAPPLRPGVGFSVPPRTTLEIESLSVRALPAADAALARKYEAEVRQVHAAAGVIANLHRPLALPVAEEFNDNGNGWPVVLEGSEIAIRDGKLEFENLSAEKNTSTWITKQLASPPAEDFEIALTLEAPDGTEAGLIFDADNNGRRFFSIGGSQVNYYEYRQKAWNRDTLVYAPTNRIRTQPAEKNELVVRVLGRRAFLLLNGAAVHAVDYNRIPNPWVGLVVGAGTVARFDRLTLAPLALAPAARTAELTRLEAEAQQARIAAGPPLKAFVETFDDNRHEWKFLGQRREGSAEIAGGVLTVRNLREKSTTLELVPVTLNQDADYELAMRARHAGGADDFEISLIWGRTADHKNGQSLSFSGNRHWRYTSTKDGVESAQIKWKRTTALNAAGEFNELAVRKLGNRLFFLINGQVLGDRDAPRLAGDQFGFELGQKVHAAFDELRVSYPERTPEATAQEREKLLATLEVARKQPVLGAAFRMAGGIVFLPQPVEKDYREMERMNKKYRLKKMLAVIADMKNPVKRAGTEWNPVLYYFYRNIDGVDYYWEFNCGTGGLQGKKTLQDIIVDQVSLTNNPREI